MPRDAEPNRSLELHQENRMSSPSCSRRSHYLSSKIRTAPTQHVDSTSKDASFAASPVCIRRTGAENQPKARCTPIPPPSLPGNGRRRTFVWQREAATKSVPRPPRPADRTRGQTRIARKPIWASADVFQPSFGRLSAHVLTCEGLTLAIAGPPGWCNSGTHVVSCCASIGQIFEYVIANAFKGNDMPFQLPVLLTWRGTDDSVFVFNLPPQMLLLILSIVDRQRTRQDDGETGIRNLSMPASFVLPAARPRPGLACFSLVFAGLRLLQSVMLAAFALLNLSCIYQHE